jgi:hypothetical protein
MADSGHRRAVCPRIASLPYIGVAMTNFALMVLMALFLFGVPLKGSCDHQAVGPDLGRRSPGPRPVLGAADRSVAQ